MVGRNDGYGGDFLERMQMSINSILSLSKQYSLSVEVIIVEWNPPEEEPTLDQALTLPELTDQRVRMVRVPEAVHEGLPNSDNIPLFEYIGKNAGIRRSEGDFVLATNPDIIYSEEIIKFFAERNLDDGCFYRTDRYDVQNPRRDWNSIEELLSFCPDNVFKISSAAGGYETVDSKEHFKSQSKQLVKSIASDPSKAANVVKNPKSIVDIGRNLVSTAAQSDLPDERKTVERTADVSSISDLYLTASGDFLLMSKENWFAINGYPELDTNLHVDSLGCVLAAATGLTQVVLKNPFRIYHLEHDRSRRKKRPNLKSEEIRDIGREILGSQNLTDHRVINSKEWGLKAANVEHTTIVQ